MQMGCGVRSARPHGPAASRGTKGVLQVPKVLTALRWGH